MKSLPLRILFAGALALACCLSPAVAETDDAKKAEREAKRQAELEKYDENKDGKINKVEREKIKADREAAEAAQKAEKAAKKAEKAAIAEQKKAERDAKKAERDAKKAEQEAKKNQN